jgi:hypothetical protein
MALGVACGPKGPSDSPDRSSRLVSPIQPTQGRVESNEQLLEWNLRSLVGDYDRLAPKDPRWDEHARLALSAFASTRVSSTNSGPGSAAAGSNHVSLAVQAGCRDPLVRYLHLRWVEPSASNNLPQRAELALQIANEIAQTNYSDVRKFYSGLRAFEAMYAVKGKAIDPAEAEHLMTLTFDPLRQMAAEPTTPGREIAEAMEQIRISRGLPRSTVEFVFKKLEPDLVKNWADVAIVHRVRGIHYRHAAWRARGNGLADTVKPESWEVFSARLESAEEALDKAWALDSTDLGTALEMMTVELGQGKGRERMETWFRRAMHLNPDCYEACASMLYYLEPKWYGSEQDMLAFGRECANSKDWGWSVPLILPEAHLRVARYRESNGIKGYWSDLKIWLEIRGCFERFFAKYPDAVGWRHNYALFAYRCEQWEDLTKQIELLGPVNYSFFGGEEAFEKMVALAEQHSPRSKVK